MFLPPSNKLPPIHPLPPRAAPIEYKTTLLPTVYGRQNTSAPPSTVVGIVLGTVGGFIFLFYLLYIALNAGKVVDGPIEEEVVVRRSGSRSRSGSPVRVRSRRSGGYGRRGGGREVDVVEVEEMRARERETVRPVGGGSRRRSSGWRRGEEEAGIVVDESVTSVSASRDGRDAGGTVEVFEEGDDSEYSSRPGRGGRRVDPRAYGTVGGGRRASGRYR